MSPSEWAGWKLDKQLNGAGKVPINSYIAVNNCMRRCRLTER